MKNTSKGVLVSIHCLVYNHEPYLRQCLDGFVMQKTNFLFEAIVHDDCSTDGSAAIIREYAEKYPDMIKPIFETTNQYSRIGFSGISKIMTVNSKGKYIAFCEGDDYWTDPYKLQKQVDILENNKNILLVYSAFDVVDDIGRKISRPYFVDIQKQSHSGDFFSSQILRNHVMTLTTCIRKEIFYTSLYLNCPYSYDYSLSLCASLMGDLHFIPEITGCYRKTPGSLIVSHKDRLSKDLNEVRFYFCLAYLKGEGKRRAWLADCLIKYKILRVYLYEKRSLKDVFKLCPSLILMFPIAWMINLTNR